MSDILNNREIAVLIWGAGVLVFLVWKAKAWPAVMGVFRSFFKATILRVITVMALYVAASAWLLAELGLWGLANLKTTLIWFFSFALRWIFNLKRWDADPTDNVKETLKEVLSLTTVVTFVTEAYTFSLIGELILVPALSFVALMAGVSQAQKDAEVVAKLFNGLLAVMGVGLLAYATWRLAGDLKGFATPETGREFAAPALLSLLFIPFMYTLNVYVAYSTALRVLPITLKERGLSGFAFRQAVLAFGLDVRLMRRWKTALFNVSAASRTDIVDLIATMKAARKRERCPPPVAADSGWCPHAAKDWLNEHDLRAGDYNPIYEGWGASSGYRKLTDGILGDTLSYYVRGNERAATKLTLTLSLDHRSKEASRPSLEAFGCAVSSLIDGALGDKADRARRGLKNRKHRTREGPIELVLKDEGRTIHLTITHKAHVEPF